MPHYMLTPTQPFIIWESRGSAVKASETPEAGTAPTAQRVPAAFRDNAERAEALAHALATTIKQEIERLKNERRNDSVGQAEIDFLEVVSATLDQIVDAIEQARQAVTSQDRDQKFAEAEKLASSLAKAGRDFAERNYERVVDFGWLLSTSHPRNPVIYHPLRRTCRRGAGGTAPFARIYWSAAHNKIGCWATP